MPACRSHGYALTIALALLGCGTQADHRSLPEAPLVFSDVHVDVMSAEKGTLIRSLSVGKRVIVNGSFRSDMPSGQHLSRIYVELVRIRGKSLAGSASVVPQKEGDTSYYRFRCELSGPAEPGDHKLVVTHKKSPIGEPILLKASR
jgi:hypothetical protein